MTLDRPFTNSRREDLFGIPKQPVQASGTSSSGGGSGTPPLSVLPTRLGLSVRAVEAAAAPFQSAPTAAASQSSGRAAHSAAAGGGPAGTSTPAPGASGYSLSTAPFQVSVASISKYFYGQFPNCESKKVLP